MKNVVVSGSFDKLKSSDFRFLEEAAKFGTLNVLLWSDEVAQEINGTAPKFHQAEPEIEMLQPDIYAVNEDGDKPEKRNFCEDRGLKYAVLNRAPASGLPQRSSTELRGF